MWCTTVYSVPELDPDSKSFLEGEDHSKLLHRSTRATPPKLGEGKLGTEVMMTTFLEVIYRMYSMHRVSLTWLKGKLYFRCFIGNTVNKKHDFVGQKLSHEVMLGNNMGLEIPFGS